MSKRCIYAYEFPDKSVYVGLTNDLNVRKSKHKCDKNGLINNHIKLLNEDPILKQLTEYINVELAQIEESNYVEKYKKNGWNILNKNKTGGIGHKETIWTYEKCKESALSISYKPEFKKKYPTAYKKSINNGWLEEFCFHMIEGKKQNHFWTFDRCKNESEKYNNRTDFNTKSNGAYASARLNGWLDIICTHMINKRKIEIWTYDKCKEKSTLCKNRTDFNKKFKSAYNKSRINNWLDIFFDN